MNIVRKARKFAKEKHKGQFRKDGITPYFSHVDDVAIMVCGNGGTEEMMAAAYLHDVMEDCNVKVMELDKEFGFDIALMVLALTDCSKTVGIAPRKARQEFNNLRLSFSSKRVKMIKLCDRINNVLCMDGMTDKFKELYIEESIQLLEAIKDGDEQLARLLDSLLFFLK